MTSANPLPWDSLTRVVLDLSLGVGDRELRKFGRLCYYSWIISIQTKGVHKTLSPCSLLSYPDGKIGGGGGGGGGGGVVARPLGGVTMHNDVTNEEARRFLPKFVTIFSG